MFIKSEGNYIEVHYQNKHNVAKKVIRQRIKNIEMSLPKENFLDVTTDLSLIKVSSPT